MTVVNNGIELMNTIFDISEQENMDQAHFVLHSSHLSGELEYVNHSRKHSRCTAACVPLHAHG